MTDLTSMVPIVIDNGSGFTKVGLASQKAPQSVFPTVYGEGLKKLDGSHPDRIGNDAIKNRHLVTLRFPVQRGHIVGWDWVEKIWQHTLSKDLNVSSQEHPLLMTSSLDTSKEGEERRKRMAQVVFEKFNVPAFHVSTPQALALHASGRSTGIVVDCGFGVVHTVPFKDGRPLTEAAQRLEFGGGELTDYLARLLNEQGHTVSTPEERDSLIPLKETLCYVPLDFDQEVQSATTNPGPYEKPWKLFNGVDITVSTQRFMAPQPLFSPTILGQEVEGVHITAHNSILKTGQDRDLRVKLWDNIVLAGGSTKFPGFAERLKQDMTQLAPVNVKPQVLASADRDHSAWLGGAMMAAQPGFKDSWITKSEFQEHGVNIVRRKCF